MRKNQVMLDVEKYIEKLMRKATSDDLQLSKENMQKYIGGLATLKTLWHILQDELNKGFITIYPEAMEARVHFDKDVTKQYGDTIAQYQVWYQFLTEDHRKEVTELVFPQTSES